MTAVAVGCSDLFGRDGIRRSSLLVCLVVRGWRLALRFQEQHYCPNRPQKQDKKEYAGPERGSFCYVERYSPTFLTT
jgi:hypothetical protein